MIGVSVDMNFDGVGAKIATSGVNGTCGGHRRAARGAKAGLKPGDVITKFDDTVIDSGPTLIGEIWQHQPGDKVEVTYTARAARPHTTDGHPRRTQGRQQLTPLRGSRPARLSLASDGTRGGLPERPKGTVLKTVVR